MNLSSSNSLRHVAIDLSATKPAPSYDILIGENILSDAGKAIADRLGKRRCLIVTDTHVSPLYAAKVETALMAAGHSVLPTFVLPAGEANKNYAVLQDILHHALKAGADRKTLIVALGGGVVGDMAGCAAALLMRGVDVVQIPTTLLAQVDSSVGGKTGIDTPFGKNTIGAFHQPRLVLIDVALLNSLPKREVLAGYAEVVKYGLIRDAKFFQWCAQNGASVIAGNGAARIQAVEASCRHKAEVVAADEREAGERALLNLGHTFGHALETFLGYGDSLLHGEAVAIGCVLAFRLSAKMGLCPAADADAVRDHFIQIGLPVRPPAAQYDVDRLMALMAQDKKAEGGRLTLILAHGIGQLFISRDVAADDVRRLWLDILGH